MLLTGTFVRAVDEKLRVAVPKHFRDAWGKQVLYLAPGTDGSLAIYTEETFSKLASRLAEASPTGQDVRAFSHGCIRLEKPTELAQWVLGWDADRVHQSMENGPDDHTVRLPRKIPVYIVYFTAYMRDGQLWFGNDLYHRDDQLAQAVAGGAMPSGDAVRAIEALRKLTS